MSPGVRPELEDVLEAFMLDADETGALARYLGDYPQYKAELIDLAHQMGSTEPDELPPMGDPCQAVIRKGWETLSAAWPGIERNLFVSLSPADYGRVAKELSIPLQVLAAIRDGRVLLESIPAAFMRRLAASLNGSLEQLRASFGGELAAARSYKSEQRPETSAPVSFEQLLIAARVPEVERERLLADDQ
ncbi:hypothetical protein GCM10022280_27560 [Sphingomonas swuensis]|uniref:Uncharacterized protein n=1 Tax=Sphingomonas swuensis TaxID=977800 RepID=A0ABP7TEP2_9SPHN